MSGYSLIPSDTGPMSLSARPNSDWYGMITGRLDTPWRDAPLIKGGAAFVPKRRCWISAPASPLTRSRRQRA
jgi:hypothetical protein